MSDLLESKSWIAVAAVGLLGTALRVWSFDAMWINPDEGIYYSSITWHDSANFWQEYSNNAHPPLFYFLLKAAGYLTVDVTALRSISLVFGCSWILAMFLFARECVGRGLTATVTGLSAALLVALSDTGIAMSQVIRPYSMQVALLTFGLYYLMRFIRQPDRGGLPIYAVLASLAVLTHYGTMFVLAGAAFGCLGLVATRALRERQVRGLLLWSLPVFVVSALCYWFHIRARLDGSQMALDAAKSWLAPFMMDGVAQAWPMSLGMFAAHIGGGFEGPAVVACGLGLGLAFLRKNIVLGVLPLATLALAMLASLAHKYPFGGSRHTLSLLIVVVPPIAFGLGTALVRRDRFALRGVVLILCLSLLHAPLSNLLGSTGFVRQPENSVRRSDYDAVAGFLRKKTESPGVVLMSLQTYNVLLPEYHAERNKMRVTRDRTISWFRWGQRVVIVCQAWTFEMARERVDSPGFLYGFLFEVDRQLPELGLGGQRRALLCMGEWSSILPIVLKMKDGTAPGQKLIGEAAVVPGFAAVEFDVSGYKAEFERMLRGGAPERGK